jgi:hypothetical protein
MEPLAEVAEYAMNMKKSWVYDKLREAGITTRRSQGGVWGGD